MKEMVNWERKASEIAELVKEVGTAWRIPYADTDLSVECYIG